MKTYYYFSKNKLRFVEIRNFYRKFVFLTLFFGLLISFLVFGAFFIIEEVVNPDSKVTSLQAENKRLVDQLSQYSAKFNEIEKQINELTSQSNDLRLHANLEYLTEDDLNFGYGGKIFDVINPSNSVEVSNLLDELNNYTERIETKINFEKDNYEKISSTLESNVKLYESIPAINPAADGYYGDRFGMRMHPILKIRRMHSGLDIVCNMNTEIFASGAGTVTFAGRKGGLGWTVEIDHGFGYKTTYGHLNKIKVKKYQKVKRGDLIALSGKSGRLSTGPHLHYEIRHNGVVLNPRNFIIDDVNIFDLVKNQ